MAGLADRADSLAGELSGGERQRVALCAAIAHRPALLLADEPTGELDRASGEAIRELLVSLAGPGGASVIVVSHDPRAAARASARCGSATAGWSRIATATPARSSSTATDGSGCPTSCARKQESGVEP